MATQINPRSSTPLSQIIKQIRELSRSGYGNLGPSPGDVIERETTKSNPTDSLPEVELPEQDALAQDDCDKDMIDHFRTNKPVTAICSSLRIDY